MIALTVLAFALAAEEPPAESPEPMVEGADEEGVLDTGPVRSEPPAVASPQVLQLDDPVVHELSDAATLHLVHVPGVRKVEVVVMPRTGVLSLVPPEEHVLGQGVGWLADAASATTDSSTLSSLEDIHNLDVFSTIGNHYGRLGVRVPLEDLAVGLRLLGEVVQAPAFPKAETKRWAVDQRRYFEVTGPASQSRVASAAMAYAWFPADHPYGRRPDLDALEQAKPKSLAALYEQWVASGPVDVLVVGDVRADDVVPPLTAMVGGMGAPGEREAELEFTPTPGRRVIAVDMPGQEQVALRLRLEAPAEGHEHEVAAWAGNYVLGGHFLSRLNTNLREEKGWTYGARSRYRASPHHGSLEVTVDVALANAGPAIDEIEGELARLRDEGVTAGELQLAYRRLVQDWNTTRGTASDAVSRYLDTLLRGESLEAARGRYLALGELSGDDVKAASQEWFGEDAAAVWVLVGDREGLAPQLEERGLQAQWITPQQAILGNF
jgi:predicted Zn-dependent peptidase